MCLEEAVTKQFWKDSYKGIERQRTELQTSRYSRFKTLWKKEGTDLQPEVVTEEL